MRSETTNEGELSCPGCNCMSVNLIGRLPDADLFAGRILGSKIKGGSLYYCPSCHLKFRYPRLTPLEYARLYDSPTEANYLNYSFRNDAKLIGQMLRRNVPLGGSVLDFGCYSGEFLGKLNREYLTYGVEVNSCAAKQAVSMGNALAVWAELSSIPDGMRFDAIVAIDVIEHVENPAALLNALSTVLSPRGLLVVTTGDSENPFWEKIGASWWYCYFPEHISFVSERWVREYATQTDLNVAYVSRFAYRDASMARRIFDGMLALCFAIVPKMYLFSLGALKTLIGRHGDPTPRGCGVTSDHLLFVLTRDRQIKPRNF